MATVFAIRRTAYGKRLVPLDVDDAARQLAAGTLRKIGHNLFAEQEPPPGFIREVPPVQEPAYQTADMQPVRRGPGRPSKVQQ